MIISSSHSLQESIEGSVCCRDRPAAHLARHTPMQHARLRSCMLGPTRGLPTSVVHEGSCIMKCSL